MRATPLPPLIAILAKVLNALFYALLSLGLAVIFGLLNIINFTHGAQYMMGAFVAYLLLNLLGIGYWWALLIAPIVVGITGVVFERLMLSKLYKLGHLYGLLLTFGLALIIQGLFRHYYGSSGQPYAVPPELKVRSMPASHRNWRHPQTPPVRPHRLFTFRISPPG